MSTVVFQIDSSGKTRYNEKQTEKRSVSPMKYRTILFDLDGTLLDTLDDMTDAVNRTLTRYGLPCRSRTEVRDFVGNGAQRLMELASGGAKPETFGAMLADYKADYAANCRVRTAPYPGVTELLKTLAARGYQLGIVSNKPDDAVKALHRDFFPDSVTVAVGERAGMRRKPAPDTLLAAMRQLGADAGSTVYVGDSDVDIETARIAGIPCISVAWGFRDRDVLLAHGADCIAADCSALLALLEAAD